MPVGGYDFVYALNTSELIYDKSSFVCYQGSHGDKVVDIANIVLPALLCMKQMLRLLILKVFTIQLKKLFLIKISTVSRRSISAVL